MLVGEFKLFDIIDYLFNNPGLRNNPGSFQFNVKNVDNNVMSFHDLCLTVLKRGSMILYNRFYFLLSKEEHEIINSYTVTIGFKYDITFIDDDFTLNFIPVINNDTCNSIDNGIIF